MQLILLVYDLYIAYQALRRLNAKLYPHVNEVYSSGGKNVTDSDWAQAC